MDLFGGASDCGVTSIQSLYIFGLFRKTWKGMNLVTKHFGFCVFLFIIASTRLVAQEESFVVEPYLQFGTKTGMVVLWETRDTGTTTVEYGEAVFDSGEPILGQRKTIEGRRTMHEVWLDGLKVETNYFWRVRTKFGSGREIVSETYSFKTAVKDETAYMFALIGDSQRNSRTPWAWAKISDLMWRDRPSFAVHAGDLVDHGYHLDDWIDEFFEPAKEAMRRFPIYTVLGNHEKDAPYYYQYMANPVPEYWYTFKYGNAQFFMIDSNRDISEGSEQYSWLEWELAKSTATWKIAVQHHPPYTSEENDGGDTYKEASTNGTHAIELAPLFERYNVDFDLFGHVHMYERTWPIREGLVNQENGVVYINSGGAGGGLEDFAPTRNWFTAELQTGHHYCTFNIFDKTVIFKAIDHEGRVFDSFQMTKENSRGGSSVVQPPAPRIEADGRVFERELEISLKGAFEDLEIYYTLDGSEPTRSSYRYSKAFTITSTSQLRTRAYSKDGHWSRISSRFFRALTPLDAVTVKNTNPGLHFKYYEGGFSRLPDFATIEPVKEGSTNLISLEATDVREEKILLSFDGFLEVKEEGRYQFNLTSDDGSRLLIHDQVMIDNDGEHDVRELSAEVILKKGKHPIRIEYFDNGGGKELKFSYSGPGFSARPLAPFVLSYLR